MSLQRQLLFGCKGAILLLFVVMGCLGVACDSALPQPKPCASNDQCDLSPNYQCVAGRCVELKNCVSNEECFFPQTQCVLGRCIFNEPCTSSSQCTKEGFLCVKGYCTRTQVTDDLALLWLEFEPRADAKPGEVWDSSGRNNHGKWDNGGGYDDQGYNGRAGLLDGKGGRALFGEKKDFSLTQMTVSAWVKRRDETRGGNILKFVNDRFRNGYGLEISGKGLPVFYVADTNNNYACQGSQPIPVDRWVHVAGSFDGANVRCFVNGRLVDSKAFQPALKFESSPELVVGGRSVEGDTLSALLDQVRVYPLPQKGPFAPDLTKYLYVADEKGGIQVISTISDQYEADRAISLPQALKGSWPVALSDDGKTLYLWKQDTQTLARYDLFRKQVLATTTVSAGWNDGALATFMGKRGELWMWGQGLFVFDAQFAQDARPKKVLTYEGQSFAADVTPIPGKDRLAVTFTEKSQIIWLDTKELKALAPIDFTQTKTIGKKPLALAAMFDGSEVFVSSQDAPEVRRMLVKEDGSGLDELGSLSISEFVTGAGDTKVKKDRRVSRMIGVPNGQHLYYTFTEPRLIYQFDVQGLLQYRMESYNELIWVDGSSTTRQKKIPPFLSSYYMHMNHLGEKAYVQSGNSGLFYVIDTKEHKVQGVITLQSDPDDSSTRIRTANQRLPIVGVLHPTQAY